MVYDEKEILKLVEEMIGENATGIYISQSQYDYAEEGQIISELVDNPFLVESNAYADVKIGATKIVFIPCDKKIPYVIKMNLDGVFDAKMDDNFTLRNISLIKTNTQRNILDEENAMIEDMNIGEQDFIKPNIYIGTYNGLKVYIQERLMCTQEQTFLHNNTINFFSKLNVPRISELASQLEEDSELPWDFIYNMIDYYGEEFVINILDKMDEEGIYDLHEGNYGYDYDGFPALIDIGGYDSHFWDN